MPYTGESYTLRDSLETVRSSFYQPFVPQGVGDSLQSIKIYARKTQGFITIFESGQSTENGGIRDHIIRGSSPSLEPTLGGAAWDYQDMVILASTTNNNYRKPIYRKLPISTQIKVGLDLAISPIFDYNFDIIITNLQSTESFTLNVSAPASGVSLVMTEIQSSAATLTTEWDGFTIRIANNVAADRHISEIRFYVSIPLSGSLRASIHDIDELGNISYSPILDGVSDSVAISSIGTSETEVTLNFSNLPKLLNKNYGISFSVTNYSDSSSSSDLKIGTQTVVGFDYPIVYNYPANKLLSNDTYLSAVITYDTTPISFRNTPLLCLSQDTIEPFLDYIQSVVDEINLHVYPVIQVDADSKPTVGIFETLFERLGYTLPIPKEVTLLWNRPNSQTFGAQFRSLNNNIWVNINEYVDGYTQTFRRDIVESPVELYTGREVSTIAVNSTPAYIRFYHPFKLVIRVIQRVTVLGFTPAMSLVRYTTYLDTSNLALKSSSNISMFIVPNAGTNFNRYHNFSFLFPPSEIVTYSADELSADTDQTVVVTPPSTISYPYEVNGQLFAEVVNLWDS